MLQHLRQARAGVTNRLDEARKTNRRLAEAGFTLIELLIVIVILGILAAVVVFSVQGIQDKGLASACKADEATITVAQESYYAQNGAYAASVDALVTAKLLHSAPSDASYEITTDTTGKVTVGTGTAAGAAVITSCDGLDA